MLQKSTLSLEQIDMSVVYDKNLEQKVDNPIMIIGEAPGANEVKEGIPFCGMAGKNLSYLIKLSNLDREKDFLITNAFPFRTFEGNKNRTPNANELQFGAKLLLQELKIVKPRMILLLGGSAKRAFLKLEDKSLTTALKSMQNHTFKEVKTNIGFLIRVLQHPDFVAGKLTTTFINEHADALFGDRFAHKEAAALMALLQHVHEKEHFSAPQSDGNHRPKLSNWKVIGRMKQMRRA